MTMIPFNVTYPQNDIDLTASGLRNQFNPLHHGDFFPLRPRAQDTPNLTVKVGATIVESYWLQIYQGTKVPLNYAGGNSPSVSAPASNPRIDLLTIDSAGTLAWTLGTEAASPAPPTIPDGKIPICYIYCRIGMTAIYNFEDSDAHPTQGYIFKDLRPLFNLPPTVPGKNFLFNGVGHVATRIIAYDLIKDVYGCGSSDRYYGMATGTAVIAGTLGNDSVAPIGKDIHAFKFAGVTITGTGIVYFRYRMQMHNSRPFRNQKASFSCLVYHDIGSAKNYTVYIRKANALNNFTTVTEIANSGPQSVPSDVSTLFKFENVDMGDNCSNGLEIEIKVQCDAITTKNFWFTELKFEVGSYATEYIYEDYEIDLMRCMPYAEKSQNMSAVPWIPFTAESAVGYEVSSNPSSTFFICTIPFKARKVGPTPTMITYDRAGNSQKFSAFIGGVWYDNRAFQGIIAKENQFILWHSESNCSITLFTWFVESEL